MADPTVLEIGEGNNITFDVKTVQFSPAGEGQTNFAEVVGATIGATVTQALYGGEGEGKTGFKKLPPGAETTRKLLGPVADQLKTGFDNILKSINDNITGGTFGTGPAGITTGIREARENLLDLANIDITKFVPTEDIVKAGNELRKLEGRFATVLKGTKDNDEGFQKLAGTFALLKTQFDDKGLLSIIETQSRDANATVDSVTEGLLKFARRSGKFAQDNNIALGTAGVGISEFTEKLSFLGREAQGIESVKLQQISRNLGLKGLPSIFTEALITFDEAANFGADLGVLLGGINIDLNEFVNALPSERVELGLSEIADAIDDGRLRIAEDGVKFGQQSALFAQQLGVTREEAEKLLRIGREGGGEAIRTALEGGLGAGAALSPEQFATDFQRQRTTAQAQLTAQRAAGLEAAPAIAGVAQDSIAILDRLNRNIEEQNIFNQLAPFAQAVQELTLIAKPFGSEEEGAKGGLVRGGILAGLDPRDLLSGFTEKTNKAGDEFATTLNALTTRLGNIGTELGNIAQKLPGATTDAAGKLTGGGPGGADAATQAIVNAFKSEKVVNAIAQSMKQAGRAAITNTGIGEP